MLNKIQNIEGYAAMFAFLETYYNLTKNDFLGTLLGGMCLVEEGIPFDQMNIEIWNEALLKAKKNEVDIEFRLEK